MIPDDERETEEKRDDTQYVAITRPGMAWGIPLESAAFTPLAVFVCLAVSSRLFNWWVGWLVGISVGVLAFAGLRALSAWRVHFARRIALRFNEAVGDLSARRFGAPSVGPQRAGPPVHAQEIPIGV